MGSPQPPSADQIGALHAAAQMKATRHDLAVATDGTARLAMSLPRQSVKLLEILLRAAP
jgi:hypothetical protein